MQGITLVLILVSFVSSIFGQNPYEDAEFNRLVSYVWNKDPNRLEVGKDLLLNWQGQINDNDGGGDVAPMPLCAINSIKLLKDPVYKAFTALLDNYEHRVGFIETETAQEKREIDVFLEAVLKTATMKTFHDYLVKQKLANSNLRVFKQELYNIWFKPYKRQRFGDSSPFEHVFVGEAKQDAVLGMHNWITFCISEKRGVFNYFGHSKPRLQDPKYKRSLRFSMHKSFKKPFGTILFGSSVEFDFGLYTVAFLKSQQLFKNQRNWPALALRLDNTRLQIQCHPFAGNRMGSCYFK
ncbi:hypothetical protein Aperf_G00000119784 [Anoplocephala perfoliata]